MIRYKYVVTLERCIVVTALVNVYLVLVNNYVLLKSVQYFITVLVEIGGLTDFSSTVAPIAASGYSCTPPNPNIQLLPNGTLITQDIDIDDSGVYMCTANNPSEVTGTISFNISVFCELSLNHAA